MDKLIALITTLVTGFLFLVGVLIIKKTNNKETLYKFSNALAFSIILGLLVFDLIPEIIVSFKLLGIYKKIVYILGYSLIGFLSLKILDCFIPVHNHHHNDNEKNKIEHNNHLFHIGVITSITIILHNIIEGMAIYTLSISDYHLGILMGITVGLHNIPMGMEISSSFDISPDKSIKKLIIYALLIISPLLGGSIMLLFKNINSVVMGILLCITCGMLIYISFFELLNEIKNNIKYKVTIYGLIMGWLLMAFTLLF